MKTADTILELLSGKNTAAKVKDWLQKNKNKERSALAQYLCGALNITDHFGEAANRWGSCGVAHPGVARLVETSQAETEGSIPTAISKTELGGRHAGGSAGEGRAC